MALILKSGTILFDKDIEEIANVFAVSARGIMIQSLNNYEKRRAKAAAAAQDPPPPQQKIE